MTLNIRRIAFQAGLVVAVILGLLAILAVLGADADALTKVILLAVLAATAGLIRVRENPLVAVALLIILAALLFISLLQVGHPILLFVGYGALIPLVLLPPALAIYFKADQLIGVALTQAVAVGLIVVVSWPLIFAWLDGALQYIFEPAVRDMNIVLCTDDPGCAVVWPIVFSALFFFVVLTSFAYTTLLERRLLAIIQQRIGPNRVGPLGFLQPAADGVKLVFKEDFTPAGASKWVFRIAPMIKTLPVLLLFAVIPIGPQIVVPWFAPSLGDVWFRVPLGVADPNVGILWLFALTSVGTYGVVLAGWASANKYAMLGALRASAQMISYELSFGLALAVPIMLASSMSMGDIINGQTMIWEWYVFQNPLAAAILLVAILAETNRAPFDLPEAEQELTQGYQTEYSGMKFAMFMMAEYLGMIAVSALAAATYFGGYNDGFGLVQTAPILGPLVMAGKIVLLLAAMIWVRATLPRIRYDRLMQFGWKIMLPAALLAVVWTAVAVVISDVYGNMLVYGVAAGIFFVLVVGGVYLMFGRTASGEDEDEALDPMITGERNSIGWGILNVVGGLLAIPFVLYENTLKALDNLASMYEEESEETAIEVTDSENQPVQSTGSN